MGRQYKIQRGAAEAMRYRDLVFDLYGTLVDIHTVEDAPFLWQKLALFYGYQGAVYAPQALHAAFEAALGAQEASAGQSYECYPELPIEDIFAALFRQKGVEEDLARRADAAAQLYRALCTEYIRLYPGVRQALTALRADGHRLWLLSNAQQAFTARELRLLELESLFDGIYLSSDYRCRKPDVRFFEALFADRGLKPEACLMIGNDPTTDVAGAKAAGMGVLYLHTNLSPKETADNPADYLLRESDWAKILPSLREICR